MFALLALQAPPVFLGPGARTWTASVGTTSLRHYREFSLSICLPTWPRTPDFWALALVLLLMGETGVRDRMEERNVGWGELGTGCRRLGAQTSGELTGLGKTRRKAQPRLLFPTLGNISSLGWIILWWERSCPVHFWVWFLIIVRFWITSLPFAPQDNNDPSTNCNNQNVSGHCQMSPGKQNHPHLAIFYLDLQIPFLAWDWRCLFEIHTK